MLKIRIDELEHLMQEKSCLRFLGMDLKRSFKKYLDGEKGNKMMEGFDENNLNLRSMVLFKKKNIKLPI